MSGNDARAENQAEKRVFETNTEAIGRCSGFNPSTYIGDRAGPEVTFYILSD